MLDDDGVGAGGVDAGFAARFVCRRVRLAGGEDGEGGDRCRDGVCGGDGGGAELRRVSVTEEELDARSDLMALALLDCRSSGLESKIAVFENTMTRPTPGSMNGRSAALAGLGSSLSATRGVLDPSPRGVLYTRENVYNEQIVRRKCSCAHHSECLVAYSYRCKLFQCISRTREALRHRVRRRPLYERLFQTGYSTMNGEHKVYREHFRDESA